MNKKIKYIIIAIILMFFSCNHVYADCSDIGDLVTDYNTYKSKLNEYLQTNSTTCDDTANNETVITCNDSKIHMNYIVSKLMKEYNEGNVCSSKKSQVEEIMKENKDNCYQVFDDDFNNFVNKVMLIFYIVGPILLILFGSLDYAKAVVASSEDELKKANKRFIKRLTATILLFLSPVIVNFILSFNLSDYYTSGNIYACDFSYKVYNKKFKINTVLTKSKNNKRSSSTANGGTRIGDYVAFAQIDPAWGSQQLLNSSDNTISSAGCALTSVAMLIVNSGVETIEPINPGSLNKILRQHGYCDGGAIRWEGSTAATNGHLIFIGRHPLSGNINNKTQELADLLNQGYYIIIQVKYGTGDSTHYIPILYVENGSIIAIDSWNGEMINVNESDYPFAYDTYTENAYLYKVVD